MVVVSQQKRLKRRVSLHVDDGGEFLRFAPALLFPSALPKGALQIAVTSAVASGKNKQVALRVEAEVAVEEFSGVDDGGQGCGAGIGTIGTQMAFVNIAVPAGFKKTVVIFLDICPHGGG